MLEGVTGERFRRRGVAQAVVGFGLLTWVVVAAAVAETGNSSVLVATAASGGLVCLCVLAGGLVAARVADAAAAARVRHVFVVLEGTALALFFPFYWFASGVEPVGEPGAFALGVVLVLAAPVVIALVLALRSSLAVHRFVVGEFGPLVPDSATPAGVPRIRALGTLLVVAGAVLSVAVVVLALVSPSQWALLEVFGLVVTLTPVVLGLSLVRVEDVYSARRRNVGVYIVVPAAAGYAAAKLASIGGSSGMLFGALVFGAIVLLVGANLVVREFTGEWDRSWRAASRGRPS
ncbi:hypothetical protein [Lentzea sp. HUAS12]|uniref:hypothetical protein n=1 Tax=Lentzea sp. HUAS12 TaxID=2951806 RepID=UPI00209CC543|nr:hypothetical protein [Lentzea sp. HUAS12]USX48463.1 hypothetical protein ND450_23575 [Lentzea sp. HUAS12]